MKKAAVVQLVYAIDILKESEKRLNAAVPVMACYFAKRTATFDTVESCTAI